MTNITSSAATNFSETSPFASVPILPDVVYLWANTFRKPESGIYKTNSVLRISRQSTFLASTGVPVAI